MFHSEAFITIMIGQHYFRIGRLHSRYWYKRLLAKIRLKYYHFRHDHGLV